MPHKRLLVPFAILLLGFFLLFFYFLFLIGVFFILVIKEIGVQLFFLDFIFSVLGIFIW